MKLNSVKEPWNEFGKKGIRGMVNLVGLGFHPDNDFRDYIDSSGTKSFSDEDCDMCNELLDWYHEAFANRKECIYGYTIDIMKEGFPNVFAE